MKKITFLLAALILFSCAEEQKEKPLVFVPGSYVLNKILSPEQIGVLAKNNYERKCYQREYYFCPPLDEVWQMEVVKDICKDPNEIVSISECFQVFECDPSIPDLGDVECVTPDGYPGSQKKICDKGKIKYTDCVSLCTEEVCDYEDNDCDGHIDEGQRNDCNECGFLPEESCDGIDNNCNGWVDEELLQDCHTACGSGVEYCIDGNWVSCTAPPVNEEICDGFDNDCDGQIDEQLNCECTIDHVGVLFPCKEPPLICGEGYKTCECTTPDCTEIVTTDCVSPCVYFPDPSEPCDPTKGKIAPEECNNYDDNCNQLIDEDLFEMCYTGDPDTLFVGICAPGVMMCYKGTWGNYFDGTPDYFAPGLCKDEVTPQEEICDGVDNDCDGQTDSGEKLGPVDVLFIVDWSGSMDTEIFAVMSALNKFASSYSDEEVLQWGTILGPLDSPWDSTEYLDLYHNLTGFSDFLTSMAQLSITQWSMGGSREMMMDAIYLSLYNLIGSGSAPIQIPPLKWSIGAGISDSSPSMNNFIINWRKEPEVKRVIILFTDEQSQSYTVPAITQDILLEVISKITNTKIYIFSKDLYKDNWISFEGWEPLCTVSGGKWYQLTDDTVMMYNNLMEIIDENACE
jgi:hypothetical protein